MEQCCTILYYLFLLFCRRLAEVSRLTRGVVVLICDIHYAKLVMDEARRLNMLEGHFFWLWVDASRDVDVFHNIGNKTRFVEDDELDSESLTDKDEARYKRSDDINEQGDIDNNLLNEKSDSEKLHKPHKSSKVNVNGGSYVKNSSINSFFRHSSHNKTEAHRANNKLLYVNFSQSYDSSRDISTEAVRNYNVNNKGVETSKIENNSIEKEKLSFPDRNYSRRTSYLGMENESFNKYVNSINVDGVNNAEKDLLFKEVINSSNVKDSILFSSDTSDFLMNPTVHTSTMHNVRDTIEKRKDRTMKEQIMEKNSDELRNNVTVIFNSLPVGLLALRPQPMTIGESEARINRNNKK